MSDNLRDRIAAAIKDWTVNHSAREGQLDAMTAEAAADDAYRLVNGFGGLDADRCYISGCNCGKLKPERRADNE